MKIKIGSEKHKAISFLKNILMHCIHLNTGFFSFLGEKRYRWIVKLGFKKQLDTEQLDNSEPFPLTNMQVHLIISEQIGLAVGNICATTKKFLFTKFGCNVLYCNKFIRNSRVKEKVINHTFFQFLVTL